MIDVLVPVLRRPQNVEPLVESIRSASRHVKGILFLCSESDTEEFWAVEREAGLGRCTTIVCDWAPGRADYARKMNYGFSLTDDEFVFLGADDLRFDPGWDEMALRVARHYQPAVIATNDMHNPEVKKGTFGTHCLVRRSYVMEQGASLEGPGHLCSEAYDHNFVDRELCHLASERGVYAFAEKSRVEHLHPIWKKGEHDSTYQKGVRNFRQDHRMFLRRMKGLPT